MVGGGYLSMKLKRKDLDQVNDDFSDFSLSSPARKIRRLDAELPPIMEEEEPMTLEHAMPDQQVSGGAVFEEELDSVSVNQEKAIVLFNPLFRSSSNISVSVDPLIISGFKNQLLRSTYSSDVKSADDEATMQNEENGSPNKCLAVVPWIPCQLPQTRSSEMSETEAPELMEADEVGEATMDIEDNNNVNIVPGATCEFGGMRGTEGLHQWPQSHCMLPQPPCNISTPVTWFR